MRADNSSVPTLVTVISITARRHVKNCVLPNCLLTYAIRANLRGNLSTAFVARHNVCLTVERRSNGVGSLRRNVNNYDSLRVINEETKKVGLSLTNNSTRQKRCQRFTRTRIIIRGRSRSLIRPVPTRNSVLPSTWFPSLRVRKVRVVSRIIPTTSREFTHVLNAGRSRLRVITVPRLVTRPIPVLVSRMSVNSLTVTLTLVRERFRRSRRLILTVLRSVLRTQRLLAKDLINCVRRTIRRLPLVPTSAKSRDRFYRHLRPIVTVRVYLSVLCLQENGRERVLRLFTNDHVRVRQVLDRLLRFLLVVLPNDLFRVLRLQRFRRVFLPELQESVLLPVFFQPKEKILNAGEESVRWLKTTCRGRFRRGTSSELPVLRERTGRLLGFRGSATGF